jgi:hypothetical protein
MFDLQSNLFISSVSNEKLKCRTNLDVVYDTGISAGAVVLDLSVRNLGLSAYGAANYVYRAAVGPDVIPDKEKDDSEILLKKWITTSKPIWLTNDESKPNDNF